MFASFNYVIFASQKKVIYTQGAAKGARRSTKIFREQVGTSQKNFRTVSKKRTGCPVLGRSASLR
jgi:hypothetical protein